MNGVSGYYRGYISTNNKINLTDYSRLCISCFIETTGDGIYNTVSGKKDQFPEPSAEIDKVQEDEFRYTSKGKNLDLINIPDNFNNHIIVYSCHSQTTTYYFDYKSSYMRNYSYEQRYIDIYNIVALKEDDWKTWAKVAKIDIEKEESNTLEKILNNVEIMQQIYQNEMANQYLLKCSGTLMVEILKNDNSYYNIPESLKEKMRSNENWNKFFMVCERE